MGRMGILSLLLGLEIKLSVGNLGDTRCLQPLRMMLMGASDEIDQHLSLSGRGGCAGGRASE